MSSVNDLNVTIVAPEILPDYDVTLRRAVMKILTNSGIKLRLGSRVTSAVCEKDSLVELDNGRQHLPVDALLLCLGRSRETPLSTLNLDAAGVSWNTECGVKVHKASL